MTPTPFHRIEIEEFFEDFPSPDKRTKYPYDSVAYDLMRGYVRELLAEIDHKQQLLDDLMAVEQNGIIAGQQSIAKIQQVMETVEREDDTTQFDPTESMPWARPRTYTTQTGIWYRRINPVTGESKPQGPFYSQESAEQSIRDDYAQLQELKRQHDETQGKS